MYASDYSTIYIDNQVLAFLSNALFDTHKPVSAIDINALCSEASQQAVLPLVYSEARKSVPERLDGEDLQHWRKGYYTNIRRTMQVAVQHTEVHRLMTEHHIPYVILKGCASGRYYPEPTLRSYGDVDFMVYASDFAAASAILVSNGFVAEPDNGGIHVAFHRRRNEIWELHRSINGVPEGTAGDAVRALMGDILETRCEVQGSAGVYFVPDDFHHGFILLLHTASHLTSEGIGLRHLCDWAVFVNKVDVEQWKHEWEICGLYRFAQILTAVSTKYLGLPEQAWVKEVDDELIDQLMDDILSAGNFGTKDMDRTRQIKYISNRGEHTVNRTPAMIQLWKTITAKSKIEHKSRVQVMTDYITLLRTGQRRIDGVGTIKDAEKRKKLYSKLGLFE